MWICSWRRKNREITEREDAMLEKADKVEKILQQAAKVLASNTNYATMVSAPKNSRNTLKFNPALAGG